ncbi:MULTISPECIES: TetR/AcrR family transcriptional regulator [Mobiluncus]|uniref:Transcriptional regulator, TetR family n=3 Tax=Mobiluncus TaxID=2050 RepID=D6ZJF8_MOBCV|nr:MULTISPECIES: TetR/AcrR family transcriptional regulator [Mobiluncus]ADI66857.1 transcriptional regulator, TetR family [Mobiluncus curtisii ATCC 43063]EFU81246.1 transcriptional regulator, TetR family [Mobiluncus holmesii ATCC 35242]MCV0020763.1 TetR/AcrR family transcriptional regulator [Mobiluncus curtisii]NMW43952.1 TetR/AcrR family transcriptional regulator [Mobiluncus curtisii]NMW46665.1 TetR/AcrR family transcriptional regulator [Mobiluncus curtisii]
MAQKRERGPYQSGLARREAILDAAVDLLAEVGYHGMSLRDVARHVGISHPGVIYHFPSKEVLLMSVVQRYEKQLGFDLDNLEKLDALPVLDTLLEVTSRLNENPMIIEVECMMMVEACSEIHPAHDHYMRRSARLLSILRRAWSRLQQDGKVSATEDPLRLAEIQAAVFNGILIHWLYDRDFDASEELARYFISVFLPQHQEELLLHYRESGWIH